MKLAFAEAVLVLEEYDYMESLRDDDLASRQAPEPGPTTRDLASPR
jgi:hypothetical protein